MPRSRNPSASCTSSIRTRRSTASPVAASETTRPPPTSTPEPCSASPASCRRPTSTLGVSASRPRSVKPRELKQRRPQPAHSRRGRRHPPRRAVHALDGRRCLPDSPPTERCARYQVWKWQPEKDSPPLLDLLPPRGQTTGPRRRHPDRRRLLVYGAANRLDVQPQPPGDFLLRHTLHQMQVADLGPLRHP